ncbi:Beta-ketothiolase BktB [Enhygromyxa salina]|uniref:Beta-ketothiolase BktB n=1 Tax=Enhygromyxa salina TaxID=215803 RepID=A0A2S9XKJ4_9BACT|nr:thiolase family protein [Enhygromyxa salina]PRP93385.1 Beta-ketothiolase BktB [Enhygromyxa salina]
MRFDKAFLPAGGYWSTPFSKWGGSFANLHPLKFAAEIARKALAERAVDAKELAELVVGWTVPSPNCFYAAPWVAGMIGADSVTGAIVSQACATSAAALAHAAAKIESDDNEATLVVLADKTSNGPHMVYPNPLGPGGKPDAEDWVWDSFSRDPWAKNSMLETAENVAREAGVTREQQDALTLHRHQQYEQARSEGFYKRYMVTPVEVNPSGRRVVGTVDYDEGVFATTAEGLAKLRPVMREGGTVTFGSQTHPADGNAGLLVCSRERATAWSRDGAPVRLLSYGQARVEKGYMAKAVVPAARKALADAGLGIGDMKVIKTHNPFAVNDLFFARQMEIEAESFNNYGSSLIFGHPQGPTGARLIAEGIEEARLLGGGHVLFAGCAAGDTAAAVVLEV